MSRYIIQKNTASGLVKVTEISGDDWDANAAFTDALKNDDGADAQYDLYEILPSGVTQFIKAMRPSEWQQKLAELSNESTDKNNQ